jgi:hypothetical protein
MSQTHCLKLGHLTMPFSLGRVFFSHWSEPATNPYGIIYIADTLSEAGTPYDPIFSEVFIVYLDALPP